MGFTSVKDDQFVGRVGFISEMPSNDVSLYINNTHESDSGFYLCQIIIPDSTDLSAELRLDVKGNTLFLAALLKPCII